MLDKIKNIVGNKDKDEEKQATSVQLRQPIQPISLMSSEEMASSKKILSKLKDDCEFIGEIVRDHTKELKDFLKEQAQNKKEPKEEEEDEDFTLAEDILEVKDALKSIHDYFSKIEKLELEIRSRVDKYNSTPVAPTISPETEQKLAKCEEELRQALENSKVQKEIQNTLKQQCVLYTEETRKLQDKIAKVEKELTEKSMSINNLLEQKQALLDMKNSTNPEVEGLKIQAQEYDKRLTIQKTRYAQKQKQAENLRKKLDEQRANLQAMADELKEKELKSKKIVQKYQKSKIEIRKYREQKSELIRTLNLQLQSVRQQNIKLTSDIEQLQKSIQTKDLEIQDIRNKYDNTVSSNLKTLNLKEENTFLANSLREKETELEAKVQEFEQLRTQNRKLQEKRQSLLAALDKPVQHEVKTLQKIHKALDSLYKDYIIDVFDQGNTVQFEKKISTIITNVLELKEDLLL